MSDTQPTAAILIIGNEILSGRTQDANLAYLARQLGDLGIKLAEARVVPDIEAEIIAALDQLRARYSYVFTTGGIGPTHDDITSATVAKAFGRPLLRHPEAFRRLEAWYPPGQFTPARQKMAEVPEGATLVDNVISRAPGFRIENVFVLAGIPAVAKAMFDGIKGELRGGPRLVSAAVACDLAEGVIAADLAAIQGDFAELDLGSYPWVRRGQHGTTLVARGADAGRVAACATAVQAMIIRLGGTAVEEPST